MTEAEFDVFATYRRDFSAAPRQAGRRVLTPDDEDDDSSSTPAPAASPGRPRRIMQQSESDSDSDDEPKDATPGLRRTDAQTFVGIVRDSALPDADEDDHIICEEKPIDVTYDATGIDRGSGAYWVLEYERALIAEESLRAQREIRAKVKAKIIESAHKKRLAEARSQRKREVEAEKKKVEDRIAALKSELEAIQGGRAAPPGGRGAAPAPPSDDIMKTFSGGIPTPPVAGPRRVLEDGDVDDRLAELEAEIAARREATERVLAVMRAEVQAFGAHLMAEAKAIAELQRKKKIPGVLQTPIAARTPEALNAIVGQVEAAYETLF